MPAKYKDEAPIVVTDDKGVDQWMYQGRPQGVSGLNAVVSWPAEEWGRDPAGFAEMRPGVYDVHERVRDMNRNGILASMCFPTFTGFSARHLNMTREDVTLVMVSAYNDWHIDEWAGSLSRTASSRSRSCRRGIPRRCAPRSAGSRPRAAGRSPCRNCRTWRVFRATTTTSTGARCSARCPRRTW